MASQSPVSTSFAPWFYVGVCGLYIITGRKRTGSLVLGRLGAARFGFITGQFDSFPKRW